MSLPAKNSASAGAWRLCMSKLSRYSIVLPVIALYLYLAGSAPYLGQWDSYDYLKQIVTHEFSDLGIGRPVFIGYNILLWETARSIFDLDVLKVETVIMAGTVLLGFVGVILFQKLARQFLPSRVSSFATLALALSPLYAIYAGYIMTEIPMLVALMAAALVVVQFGSTRPLSSALAGGILFGLAAGIREQALTMGAAFVWMIWSRRQPRQARIRDLALFGCAASAVTLAPAVVFYLADPNGFTERIRVWLHAIPMGQVQFWSNVQASLLYAFCVCPGAWLALAGAAVWGLVKRQQRARPRSKGGIPNPWWGLVCSIVVPIVVLWRDADVQIHPRYLLPILPGSVIMCAYLYGGWIEKRRGAVTWGVIQVAAFGLALAAFSPLRQIQMEKMEFAEQIREAVPGEGLLIAGGYSPILDYYRGIGLRPGWRILWSGWDWSAEKAESAIRRSWAEGIPVYLSQDARGWSYFESEYLSLQPLLKESEKEIIVPRLVRISPR